MITKADATLMLMGERMGLYVGELHSSAGLRWRWVELWVGSHGKGWDFHRRFRLTQMLVSDRRTIYSMYASECRRTYEVWPEHLDTHPGWPEG